MSDLPDGYIITAGNVDDIPALIAVDKAASTLFEPTELLEPEALEDRVEKKVAQA